MDNAERYIRQVQLPGFGQQAQQNLSGSRVLVIGAGGLGVPVLQYLTGMGIGTIGIADGDTISLSNLHRQVLYSQSEIGLPKVEVAASKLAGLNPSVIIHPYNFFITITNALELIRDYDLVIDATDNFSARYLINDACVILHKPFIYGAVHQFEGHVSLFNYQDGPTYRCLYPVAPAAAEIPDCNAAGVLGVVPGIIGMNQALEAVKLITGIAETSSGYLQIFDFLNGGQCRVKLVTRPENKIIYTLQNSYDLSPCNAGMILKAEELYQWYLQGKDFYLVDVREPHEFRQAHLKYSHLIPLQQLTTANEIFPKDVPLVAVCQSGSRSLKAVPIIQKKNPGREVYNLQGGLQEWQARLGDKFLVI